jgi:hypothetical protein
MDVNSERSVVRRVIERLAIEYAYHFRIELVMSELEPILATQTPQAGIVPPSTTDIVVALLWSRLGTPLPKDPRFVIEGDQDRRPTGTEWEFFDAFRANKTHGLPDLLVYRKTMKITADLADETQVLEGLHQKRELDRFLNRWFRNPDGSWKAWFHSFEVEEDLEHLVDNHLRKLLNAKIAVDPRTDDTPTGKMFEGNPYRGLQSFGLDDAPLYFGRTRSLNELKEVLETQNALQCGFVIVTGSSGSGKSSLLKAGLLADLKNPYRIGRVAHCRHAIMRPTDHSGKLMVAVAHALLSDTALPELNPVGWSAQELANVAAKDPQRLVEALRHAAGVVARGEKLRDRTDMRLCLIIDQLEELFTAGIPRPAINEFTRLVTLLARSEIVWVIAALRSDFYHRLDDLPDLLLLAERGFYRLKSPLPTELGQMIRKPAQLAGLRFESHPETDFPLDGVLQDDAISDPTALPLLEFALTELWNQRTADGLLTFDAYERMGRMTGAIAEHAEQLISTMSPATQAHLASTLRALVTVSGGDAEPTAASVDRSRIATTPERTEILDGLIAARLVMTDDLENRGDPRCRLAHEKLLETWPRLRKLALADRQFLQARGRLRTAAEAWANRNRIGDLLLPRGSQLAEGETTLKTRPDELDALTIEFIESSIKAEHNERNRKLQATRRIAASLAGLAVVSLTLLGITLSKQHELVSKEREARDSAALAGQKEQEARISAALASQKEQEALDSAALASRKEQEARDSATLANRGFGLAMQAATDLSQTVGASGSNIEGIFTTADRLVEETAKANTGAPDDVQVQRGALLLSFAATNERLGDFQKQRNWLMLARKILDEQCGSDAGGNAECRATLANTYEAEGNYQWRINNPTQAIGAYRTTFKLRPDSTNTAAKTRKFAVANARTLSSLARAQISAKMYADAQETAIQCRNTVKLAISQVDPPPEARLVEAMCELRAAQAAVASRGADGKYNKLEAALAPAEAARKRFEDIRKREPGDVAAVMGLAATLDVLGNAYYYRNNIDQAEKYYTSGVDLLSPIARSNPQNDNIATLLNELFSRQITAYKGIGRNELAAASSEARVELAAAHLEMPRSSYWQRERLNSLRELVSRYAALNRSRDAFNASEGEVKIRREELEKDSQNEGKRRDLAFSLAQAGNYGRAVHEGLVAFERYGEAIELSERWLAEQQSGGLANQEQFLPLRGIIYSAIEGLSFVTVSMLPQDRRVLILEAIVALIDRQATADARVITFRHALGRSRHQLAVAQEQSGDITAALDTHERASKIGWRASTIVMRRWFLEGYRSVKVDLSRAQELETLANRQADLARWDIPTKNRTSGSEGSQQVYLEEPDSNTLPIADEVYRLRRYRNADINDRGAKLIKDIYEIAKRDKVSVAAQLDRQRRSNNASRGQLVAWANDVQDLIKNDKLGEAYRFVDEHREELKNDKTSLSVDNRVLRWGVIAEVSHAVAAAANEKQNAKIAEAAEADERAALDHVRTENVEGSSPRLMLAQRLEQLAQRAVDAKRDTAAIALYENANELRKRVRMDDPKNADCACRMATNFDSLSSIYARIGKEDDALRTMLAAVNINEEMLQVDPGARWEASLAATALKLAELYGKRAEPRSALLYAQRASTLRSAIASNYSADSKDRIFHAAALEAVARYAHSTAAALPRSRTNETERLYTLAINSLQTANKIRESVLTVDPANGDCRCHVGSNYANLATYYKETGRQDQSLASLLGEVEVRRRQTREEPENFLWKIALVDVLARAVSAVPIEPMDERIRPMRAEEVNLRQTIAARYRALADAKSDKDNDKQQRLSNLIALSFNALFVAKDQVALAAAEEALSLNPNDLLPATNKAHALMYIDRLDEARQLYLQNQGKMTRPDRLWEQSILSDFDLLTKFGRKHPLMDEVARSLKPPPKSEAGMTGPQNSSQR